MNENKLYAEFEWEVARSEYTRTRLTIAILLIGIALVIGNYFVLDESIIDYYGGLSNYLVTVGWLVIFIGYELVILKIRRHHLRKRATASTGFRLAHIIIETSFPSVIIFYNILNGILPFIDSPITVVYFIFIILSILCLEFKFSFITGLVASAGYFVSVIYGFHFVSNSPYSISLPENLYIIRVLLMLISGAAAGFVANEVKKGVLNSFDVQRSKAELETLFGQQVSREVYHSLIEERGTVKKQEATVLALDIRNFSEFAEQHSPSEIIEYQNKVFGPILDIVIQHQGVVNQILGDGIMATFGAPGQNPLHAEMAFQTSLVIRQKIRSLSESALIPYTRIGIGLHTGEVVTGNIGNDQRKQFSISGTAVIIAFRVEQLNKDLGSEILITEEVKSSITAGKSTIHNIGPVSLRGLGKSVTIYQVL